MSATQSNSIPEDMKIDFSGYETDMSERANKRLLSQFQSASVFKQYLEALVDTGPQWTYGEIVKQIEANTLYEAQGENLDVIGRIVGAPREAYEFDDSMWFMADNENQGCDAEPCWVIGAPLAAYTQADDQTYRMRILARIACNFNRFSSIPELIYFARLVTGEEVSFQNIGPMEAQIIVRSGISNTVMRILTESTTTSFCDDVYALPYPATLNLSIAAYVPDGYFCADLHDGRQCDVAPCAVGVPLNV